MVIRTLPIFIIITITALIITKVKINNYELNSELIRLEESINSIKKSEYKNIETSELEERKKLLKSYFNKSITLEDISQETKENLQKFNLNIVNYSLNETYIQFTIFGKSKDFSLFISEYLTYKKSIYISNLLISKRDKATLSINFEIRVNKIENSVNNKYIIDKFRDLNFEYLPANKNLLSFFSEQKIKETQEVVPLHTTETDSSKKFQYLGSLKKESKHISIFKDTQSGRIYKFQKNQTISEWKYLGATKNGFLFTNKNKKYEVLN